MKRSGLGNKESDSFSTALANATTRALRAARVERATRWGARVLWGGGVGVGALAWRFEQDASTVEKNVVIVLLAAVCVGIWGALKQKSETRGRRGAALLAAKRLEKRFEKQAGVFVAAVDFSEEAFDSSKTEATSEALRVATVELATRGYAEIASTLDEPELFAVLTARPTDRFRKIEKTRRFCALGVLANIVIWGSAGNWEKERDGNRPGVCASAFDGDNAAVEIEKNKRNEENKRKEEEKKVAENKKVKENGEIEEEKIRAVDETLNLATWELLISELAQNAEIAETLAAELKRAVDAETRANEKTASSDATAFLQLARELGANLSRPETGLVAQTRRLNAAAERERRQIEARLAKIGELNALVKSEEKEKIGKMGGAGEDVDGLARAARRITGKDVAVFLTEARLTELETRLTSAGGVGDWTTLELSRVLRSDLSTERTKILTEASARVGEFGTMLRREETAARILSESWRFDAASRLRETLVKRALKEDRALLARFAGSFNGDFNASPENDVSLNDAKRRFNALWRETERAERECVAIVERLRERLQGESTQEFIEFAQRNEGVLKELGAWTGGADETVGRALDDITSQNEERWAKIAKDVENNRFGRAAERLENAVASLGEGVPTTFDASESNDKGGVLNVDIEGISGVEDESAEKAEDDVGRERRRFSALAALLTLGVDKRTSCNVRSRSSEKEDGALFAKSTINGDLEEKKAEEKEGKEGEESSTKEPEGKTEDALSQNALNEGEKRLTANESRDQKNEVNVEKIEGWNESLDGDFGDGESASEEKRGSENGATAVGVFQNDEAEKTPEPNENKSFNAELPPESRRRLEGTTAPEILPEYAEKIQLYRRRVAEERR